MSTTIVLFFCQQVYPLAPNRTLTQYVHRIWQVPQGLPEGTIFAIRQTTDGYLWLGTQTGLVRFDGVRFNPIHEAEDISLTDLWVQDLLEDQQHDLWVASDGAGLVRFGNGKARRFTEVDGLPSENIHCLLADRRGGLWCGTTGGLARLAEGKFTVYTKEQGLAVNDVRALCQARDGSIWAAGGTAEISVWNGNEFSVRSLSLPPRTSVHAMRSTQDGSIWIGTNAGLVQIKDGKEQRFTTADGLADDWVFCLAEGNDQCLWIGTKQGFSRLQNGEIDSFRPRDGLSQSTVYAMCEDHEGSLWVGTKHGLNQFSDRRTTPFTVSEGLPSNDAGPVFQDRSGQIWVGTLGAGLGQFDGRHFSVLTEEQGLASNTVRTLADGDEGELWVGTDQGLTLLKDHRVDKTFTTADGLPANSVRCLFRDHAGVLWTGTSAGVAMLQAGRFVEPGGNDLPRRVPILAITQHDDHILLALAEGGGLYRYADGRFQKFAQSGTRSADVDAFYEDSEGLLWMGTRGGGLDLLQGNKTSNFAIQDGLYDDEIYGIVADEKDELWMGCSKGIFSVNRSELRKLAAGAVETLKSTPFSPTEALRTIECKAGVQPAVWKMRDGEIWFSTVRGLIVIDPKHLDRKFPPAPVVVEEVIVNGKSRSPIALEDLPPGRTNLTFRYTALSFRAPTRITFRYKLEGFDKDWVDAGSRREAFYTNLSPGTYHFRVQACNVDGTCNEAANPIQVTLEPTFYQARWFLPLCGGMVVLAGGLAYRLRVRRIREHLQVVLTERSRIARELHDTLMQGFSGVTMEMQALMSRLPHSEERATLEEIIHDAAICLREARRSVAGLRNSTDKDSGLAVAIAQAARHLTETKDIRLKLALGQSQMRLPADVEYNMLRIAQEAISNSVKHASARSIEVDLDFTPDQVHLAVKDDGVGFVVQNGDGALAGHYGLLGMRERASQIGAEFRLESEPGRGTSLYVSVPALPAGGNGPLQNGPQQRAGEQGNR